MSSNEISSRIKEFVLGLPIQAKVMAIAIGMTFSLAAVLAWQIHHAYFRLEEEELIEQARFVAELVALNSAQMLRNGQETNIQSLLETAARISPATGTSIDRIQVRGGAGRDLAQVSGDSKTNAARRVFEATAALPGNLPGAVEVALSDGHVGYEIAWHTRQIFLAAAAVAVVGLLMGWGAMRLVTGPICELARFTRAVKAGDYSVRARVRTKDEVGALAGAFNELMSKLQRENSANRQLLRLIILAEEEERRRVARELHDHTGQALTSLIVSLGALRNGQRTAEVEDLLTVATQALSEVHDLSRALRPGVLDELGLGPALRKLTETLGERTGFKVEFAAVGLDETARLPRDIEVALYRIAQEALTNAMRHGRATSAEVLLQRKPETILLVIEDDGAGFDIGNWRTRCLRGEHLGLLGIDERATLLGGTFRLESRPGNGTSLFVEVPLREEAHA
jgi:signal transduction histidine kinase